ERAQLVGRAVRADGAGLDHGDVVPREEARVATEPCEQPPETDGPDRPAGALEAEPVADRAAAHEQSVESQVGQGPGRPGEPEVGDPPARTVAGADQLGADQVGQAELARAVRPAAVPTERLAFRADAEVAGAPLHERDGEVQRLAVLAQPAAEEVEGARPRPSEALRVRDPADQDARQDGITVGAGHEQEIVDLADHVRVGVHHLPVGEVAQRVDGVGLVDHPFPRVATRSGTVARLTITMRTSRITASTFVTGPFVFSPTYAGSFATTRIGKNVNGTAAAENTIENSATLIGSKIKATVVTMKSRKTSNDQKRGASGRRTNLPHCQPKYWQML